MEKALGLLLCLMVMAGCSSTTGQKTHFNSDEKKGFITEYRNFNGYPGFRVIRASAINNDAFFVKNNVAHKNSEDDKVEVVVAQSKINVQKILPSSVNKGKIRKASLNPTYMLSKGETLLQVAEKLQFSKENLSRAAVAIWINNMEKFVQGNMNGVRHGMVLDLSGLEARVLQMDMRTAQKIIKKQKIQWASYIKSKNQNQEFAKVLSVTPVAPKPSNKTLTATKIKAPRPMQAIVKKSTVVSVVKEAKLQQTKWSLVSVNAEAPKLPSSYDKTIMERPLLDLVKLDKVYEKVLSGDNLFKIADRLGYLKAQKIKAAAVLWLDNKDQFVGQNMNNLKPGIQLDITNLSIGVSKIDFYTAENILIKNGEKWPKENLKTPSSTKFVNVVPAPILDSTKDIMKAPEKVQPRNLQKQAVASVEKEKVARKVENVLEGDTLLKIVNRLGYSKADKMKAAVALWNLNKAKFINGNMNGIRAGKTLNFEALPAEMDKLDHMAAIKVVKTQWREWKGKRVSADPIMADTVVAQEVTETKVAKVEAKELKVSEPETEMAAKKPIIEENAQVAALPEVSKPPVKVPALIKSEPVSLKAKPMSIKKEVAPNDDNQQLKIVTPMQVSQESEKPKLTFEAWKNSIMGIVNNLKSKFDHIKNTVTEKFPVIYTKAIDLLEDMEFSKSNEGQDKAQAIFN